MASAPKLLAARNGILLALDAHDIPRINFRALAGAIADAVDRGWTGDEIARHATAGVYTGETDNVGALVMANIRALAQVNPPREATPAPPVYDRATFGHAVKASSNNPSGWVARIRGGLR